MWRIFKTYKYRVGDVHCADKTLVRSCKFRLSAIFYIKYIASWDIDEINPFISDRDYIISYTLGYDN